MIEVLKQAIDALEKNYKLINGEGTRFGLEGAMDGYYSGCFDVDGTNKETENSITSLRQAIREHAMYEVQRLGQEIEQEPVAFLSTDSLGERYLCFDRPQDDDPVQSLYTHPPQRTEQNFCPRCGKRTNDIHTCTPPQENT